MVIPTISKMHLVVSLGLSILVVAGVVVLVDRRRVAGPGLRRRVFVVPLVPRTNIHRLTGRRRGRILGRSSLEEWQYFVR